MSNSRSGKWFLNFNSARSAPLFLRGDLKCKNVVIFIFALNLKSDNLYDWHVALLGAVPWVRPFFSEFSVYSAVI